MKKTHLIKDKKIRECLDNFYLPAKTFIKYLLENVEDFKHIKLNKPIENTCLKDLNITNANFFNYNFEYELSK